MSVLKLDRVKISKNRKVIIEDMSFSLQSGQITGVVGANGAGKSTLLAAIARQTGFKGTIEFDAKPVDPRKIAYMPQSWQVNAGLTVLETVMLGKHEYLGWRICQAEMNAALNILHSLGMEHLSSRAVSSLSGGQQQLVLLGQRLIRQPELLVLDEVTSALDIAHQIKVLHLLRDYVTRSGALVLIAIHDLNLALAHSDKLLLIDQGQQVAIGNPEDVLHPDRIAACYGIAVEMIERLGKSPVIATL